MSRRRTLTDNGVAVLRPKAARYAVPDPELRGHYVRVQPTGAKAFVTVARNPAASRSGRPWPADALSMRRAAAGLETC